MKGREASASSCFASFFSYVDVAEMNEKRDERAIFKSIDRWPDLF